MSRHYATMAYASPGTTEEQIAHVLPRSGLWGDSGRLVVLEASPQTLHFVLASPDLPHEFTPCKPPYEKLSGAVLYDDRPTAILRETSDQHNLTPGILVLWDGAEGQGADFAKRGLLSRLALEVWLCEPDKTPRPLSPAEVRERLDALRSKQGGFGATPVGGCVVDPYSPPYCTVGHPLHIQPAPQISEGSVPVWPALEEDLGLLPRNLAPDDLLAYLAARAAQGRAKYGVELHTLDGRNPWKDARDETADQPFYNCRLHLLGLLTDAEYRNVTLNTLNTWKILADAETRQGAKP